MRAGRSWLSEAGVSPAQSARPIWCRAPTRSGRVQNPAAHSRHTCSPLPAQLHCSSLTGADSLSFPQRELKPQVAKYEQRKHALQVERVRRSCVTWERGRLKLDGGKKSENREGKLGRDGLSHCFKESNCGVLEEFIYETVYLFNCVIGI